MDTKGVELIEPELSYQIVGVIYKSFNELGFGFQERYYQRAFARLLEKEKIKYQRELSHPIKLKTDNLIIGRYIVDFLVEGRVVIEWKVGNEFYESHVNQVLAYLKSNNYRLGIIALVTPQGVKTKRLVN